MEPDEPEASDASATSTLARRWPPARASEIDRPVWLALVVALVLLITANSRPGGESIATLFGVGLVLLIATRWSVPPLAIAILVVVGIGLRVALQIHWGSDVMDVVAAAIRRVEIGQNPYGTGYTVSRPPGAPYAYGPLPLLWYLPVQENGWQLELMMASVVLTLLALRGKLLGLALYAVAPTLVATTGDGSNDTSAGLLLLIALGVADRRPRLGALLLAVAAAFKPYAAAWAPALFLWGGWTVAATFIAASVVLWAPILLVWGVGNFLMSLDLADRIHNQTYWSLGDLYESVFHHSAPRDDLNRFRIGLGIVTAILTLRWARSMDGVILAGTVVYLLTLYAGFWSTYAYFGAIAPILCWKIDGWLGIPARPLVRLPEDEPPLNVRPAANPDRKVPAT